MKEETTIYLKNGKEIRFSNADEKKFVTDNLFKAVKENEYCYLVPTENILYIETVSM